jgi:hypothetical protein
VQEQDLAFFRAPIRRPSDRRTWKYLDY